MPQPNLPRVCQLRANVREYDAVFMGLAEALSAPPITRDGRLAGAARHSAKVALV